MFQIYIFLLLIFVIRSFWKNRRFFYLASKIPTSSFDKSFSGLLKIFNVDNKTAFKLLSNSFVNLRGCTKTWFYGLYCEVIEPADIKIVLNSENCMDKPFFIKFFNIPQGSLFGELKYWQSHRRIMNPYFGSQALKDLLPIFNERSKVLVKVLEKMGNAEFDVMYPMTAMTLDTIMRVMEYEIDLQEMDVKLRDVYINNLLRYLFIES